jgi:Ca2+-binding EF-hand superfamily protein
MIRTAITLAALAAVAATVSTTPALAQETPATAAAKYKREFAATDTNKDGFLTRAEVQARISRMNVGPGRPDAVHAKRLADLWFDRADANKDGKVTEAEGQALLIATMKRYDANRDGRVDAAERGTATKALER